MKATVLLLICLAVVTITQAGHDRHDKHDRHDRHDRRQDTRDDSRRRDSRENDGQNRSQDSRENNKQEKRQDNSDNRQEGRNDERQSHRRDSGQDMREERRQERGQDRRQDIRETNEQDRMQDNSEKRGQDKSQNSWQENKQPWRDIVIENRGKIVNNGEQRDGQQRYTQKQELLDQLGYTQTLGSTTTTNMDTLLKQKFLISILLNVNDVATEEQLEELGQTLILDEQKYIGSFDDDMRHLVQLCVDGQMLRKTDNFNGLNTAHLRQLHGLYKILVRAQDWVTFQRNACFARLHLNRVLLANALLLAVKERQDTQKLVMPAMNEILPELFNDKHLLQVSRNINLAELLMERTTMKTQLNDFIERIWGQRVAEDKTKLGQQLWGNTQKTWQEWRQERLDRQAVRGEAPKVQNELQKLVLVAPMKDDTRSEDLNRRISYLTQDAGLSNFWYSLNMDCLREMRLPGTERKEIEVLNNLSTENQRKEDQINEPNNERLLQINRRRWKQNQDQTAHKELLTKQIIGSDSEQTGESTKQRQVENGQRVTIDSRKDASNEDERRAKEKSRLIVESLLRILVGGKQKIVENLDSSKSRGMQEHLSQDNNEEEHLLRDNRRSLNTKLENHEDSRENDNINRRDSDEKLRKDRDNRLLKINRQRLNQLPAVQQDSRETSRKDSDENRLDEDSRRDSNEDERLLKVNRRRRLNTRNMLRGDKDESELNQKKMKEKYSNKKRGQDSNELERNDSIEQKRQVSEERRSQNSDEDLRMRQGNLIDGERLLRTNRRWLNRRNRLETNLDIQNIDQKKLKQERRQDSSEERQRDSDEKIRRNSDENMSMLGRRNRLGTNLDNMNTAQSRSKEQRRQDSSEERQRDSDEQSRVNSDENMSMLGRKSIDDQRLLKVNRRWMNRRNRLGTNVDNMNTAQSTSKEQRRQDSSEERQRDSDEKIRRNSDENMSMLGRRNRLGTNLDNMNTAQSTSKEQRRQDSSEERNRESDEQGRGNSDKSMSILRRNSIDDQRLLKVNRRWLNRRNRLQTNLDYMNTDQSMPEDQHRQDSSEERQRDYDEQRRGNSDESISMLGRKSIDDQRLLKVNRPWMNRMNTAQSRPKEQRRQDSSEERNRESEEQRRGNSEESMSILDRKSIDDQRLLKGYRRWLNRRNRLETNLESRSNEQRRQDLSEERQRDSDEQRRQNSDENMGRLGRNSIDEQRPLETSSIEDERLLSVNRRRLNQYSRRIANGNKSIWPQQNEDNQQMDPRLANGKDSDEITRRDSDESIGLTRNNVDRLLKLNHRKDTQRSLESSSQEDSNERLNSNVQRKFSEESSKESREKRNIPTKNDRLLAIGRRRLPRSVDSQLGKKLKLSELRTGEMKLVNMQQMLARLRMERLSHQLQDMVASKQQKNPDIRQVERLNRRTMETRDNRQLQMEIENVKHILSIIISEELQLVSSEDDIKLKQSNVLELIGRILMNRVSNSDLNVFQLWSHLMQVSSDDNNSLMSNMAQQLRDPAFSSLMESILSIVDIYSDKMSSYDEQLLRLDDVQLNDVKVDKLQTYFDTSDVDLINTLDQQALREQNIELKNMKSTPVARQQRLNHKSFSLKFDITSKRERRVVIRTFLGPILDSDGNALSLNENRRNFMLLDAFTSNLLPGQNSIKRKSSDINWTSRDATPLSQLYREVMLGSNDLQLESLTGNNQRFPHRLLLPRGLPQGLPMQLYIIVTPQSERDALLQHQLQTESGVLGMGTAAIGLDTLPLGFPLDRKIDNEQNLLVPNAILKDIAIYHDGEIDI